MNEHLETLLELQDMKSQRRELQETSAAREVEEEVFKMGVDEAIQMLEEKIEEMEESLPPPIRSRYQRVSQRHTRAVVPVIRGTCYGCFVSIPTSVASGAGRNAQIRHCDSCGRLLYMVG